MESYQFTSKAEASPRNLRAMAASPLTSTLQRHVEPERHTSQCHVSLHEKKWEAQPFASMPAIKNSSHNSAPRLRTGSDAAQHRASPW